MRTKRTLSIFLAAIMAASLFAGCGDDGGKDSSGGSSSASSSESKGGAEEAKRSTVSIGSNFGEQTTPVAWYDTEVWQYVRDKANVDIDYTYYDQDKYNLLLAGNDLPDIVVSYLPEKMPDIIAAGLALDLSQHFDQYPNLNGDEWKQRNEVISGTYGGEDNALYFLGNYVGVELVNCGIESARGYNLRWDWYKEIGTPEIKTADDFVSAIEQMVKNHPTTEDGKKVYGAGVAGGDNWFMNWYDFACFTKPALVNPWTFASALYCEGLEDGKLYNGYIDPSRSPFWNSMQLLNNLYIRGLFDPDSFIMTAEQYSEKDRSGQYVTYLSGPWSSLYAAEKEKDPNTMAKIVSIPNEASLVYANYHQVSGYFPSNYIFVSANAKNQEGALRFLNTLHDTEIIRVLYSGIEGKHWNYVDDVPTPTEETMKLRAEGSDEWLKTGMNVGCNIGFLQASFPAKDGYPVSLFETDAIRIDSLDPVHQDVAKHYGVDYPGQAFMKLVEEGKTVDMSNCYSELNQACTEQMPNDIRRIITQMNDICIEAIPELVQAPDKGAFDAVQQRVIEEIKSAGEQTAWDWCVAANDKAHEFTDPIIESLDW